MKRAAYLRELRRLREHLASIVEQAFVGPDFGEHEVVAPGSWSPTVDLFESADAYFLRAEVPGISKEDLDLEVDGRRLILSGRRSLPAAGGSFHRMERRHGPFRRVFDLDHDLDPERIEADLTAGLLNVRLPKHDGARRRIEVSKLEDRDG